MDPGAKVEKHPLPDAPVEPHAGQFGLLDLFIGMVVVAGLLGMLTSAFVGEFVLLSFGLIFIVGFTWLVGPSEVG